MNFENEKLKEFEAFIKQKRVAIIGLGTSNMPLIDYFYQKLSYITVFDERKIEEIPQEIINKIKTYKLEASFRKRLFNKFTKF